MENAEFIIFIMLTVVQVKLDSATIGHHENGHPYFASGQKFIL